MDISKRLDDAVRTVKEMPPSYQRAIIRLRALIGEWEQSPTSDDRQPSFKVRIRRKLRALRRFKR